MSPILKSKAKIVAATAFYMAMFAACSDSSGEKSTQALDSDLSRVSVELAYTTTPLLDSIVLDCYGTDTIHKVQVNRDSTFDLDLFPNDHWRISAKLYANGELMQEGEITTAIDAGKTISLTVPMHAIVGFVHVEIPLGFDNPAGIKSGKLTIESDDSSYSYKMTTDGINATFTSDMLPLNQNYKFKISLNNSEGVCIYETTDEFFLDEETPVPELVMKSLRAKVQFSVKSAESVNKTMQFSLPGYSRYPSEGDIVISEVFTAVTTKDSSQYEFIELFNGSLDTLYLEGCTIGTTSEASKAWNITAKYIEPNSTLVLGDNSEKTPQKYKNTEKWSALTNTAGAVVLQCMGSVLDSLYYASKPDSIHLEVIPALGSSKYGQSSQLDIRKWKKRKIGSSWCLSKPTPDEISYCE